MKQESGSGARRTRKIAAIAVGALVIGIGGAYTLASWNDSEWVWGGTGSNGPGVRTDYFEVVQNTTNAYVDAPTNWVNREAKPGDPLQFSPGALSMTPGDQTFAPVALRTEANSLAATVQLSAPEKVTTTTPATVDPGDLLWAAVRVDVYTASGAAAPSACTPAAFSASGWTQIVTDQPLATATAAAGTQTLSAEAGSTQHYCFVLELPAGSPDTLQGRTLAPAWKFDSTSVDTP